MKWLTRLAATPPAYLSERLSYLYYAKKICLTEPSTARLVLKKAATKFDRQLDYRFADKISQIIVMTYESPMKAKGMIDALIIEMRSTVE
jgi:hypothetical protein